MENNGTNREATPHEIPHSVALELLAELRNFVNGVETGMIDSPADDILANVTRRAREAISKATGERE